MSGEAPLFEVRDLHVRAAQPTSPENILHGVELTVAEGEVHAIMGPNGSGKSTLAAAIMGSPEYEITGGSILLRGDDVTDWDVDVRAKAGLFLAFQYPQEIAGVPVIQFLRQALSARKGMEMSMLELRVSIMEWMERLGMDPTFADRHLNEGFSGGEKKRNEVLQMSVLEPRLAVLDETDSGLDIDALRVVASGVNALAGPELGVLVITHYQRILNYIKPDFVHIMLAGRIVESGDAELAEKLEEHGYEFVREKHEVTTAEVS